MRLIIVSNRLPITVAEQEGKLMFKESPGGLVSGLSAYLDSLKGSYFKKTDYLWIGWPGTDVGEKNKGDLKRSLLQEHNAFPVFVSGKSMDKFYLGFCNRTIWPLFHYFPSYMVWDNEYWEHYRAVNEIFLNSVLEIYKKGDIIWVHDYHLMLLPRLIRKVLPEASIGFFLHIPFPSFEIFRLLPSRQRREILEGILGADLIGFHTSEYTQYFLRCVLRILGLNHDFGEIYHDERLIKIETFPMGIDYNKYHAAVKKKEVIKEKNKLRKSLGNNKIILSIDRLDYTKGTHNRLRAYELFLENNPGWHGKVVLVIIVVPSRIGVEHYDLMKKQIDELVGKINGKFGTVNWTPVIYQYRFLPFVPLIGLYSISDVCLVTPLRDGMNLVAKEYIATRRDRTGVLILSEMAGCVKELGESIIINPNNIEEITQAIKDALNMPVEEQIKRNSLMQERLREYDVIKWAERFVTELNDIKREENKLKAKHLNIRFQKKLLNQYKKSQKRLLLFDYDGTLTPFYPAPELAKPTEELNEILMSLAENKNNYVVLVSGREKTNMQNWFGKLRIGLVAEHGLWIKEKNGNWKLTKEVTYDWKFKIINKLKMHLLRVPGAFIEEKEFSVAWHYRNTDPEQGNLVATEIIDEIVHLTANLDLQVLKGNRVIEIRPSGVNKGIACRRFVSKDNFDFILAVGDDETDEDMFKALPEFACSIRIGMTSSFAHYNMRSFSEFSGFLKQLCL